jgi:type IV secretion system protein VirB10
MLLRGPAALDHIVYFFNRIPMRKQSLTAPIALILLALLAACGGEDTQQAAAPVPAAPADSAVPAAPVSPAVIQTLLPAKLVVRPSNVRLGPILPGESQSASITLANEGEEVLTIREIRLDADPTELSATGSCLDAAPKVLARSETCELKILFVPIQSGGDIAGEVVITPEGDNPPVFVPVAASRAVQPPAPPSIEPMAYAPSPALENAIAVYQQRRGGRMMVVDNELPPGANDVVTKDQDYTPLGFAPTISTLPVDRSRLVTADKYIPAVLENTINSQLPGGRIVGVVETHVYGGDGRLILLPAGSRAIGVYESLGRQGDTRLRASFVRVMRPDGAAIAIDGDPAADPMGRLGLIGDVDNRYFDRFAGPLLISLINAIGSWATAPETIVRTDSVGNANTSQTLSPEQQGFQNFANDLSFVTQRLVEENLNLAPIITVPGGTRFYIMPTRDIMLQGYSLVAAPGSQPGPGAVQFAAAGQQGQQPATTPAGEPFRANPDFNSPPVPANRATPGVAP